MKKLLGLALLGSLLFAGTANAAFYRVDFAGTVDDGIYDGYFTFSDVGFVLDSNGAIFSGPAGLEEDLEINYAYTGVSGSFNETTAGVSHLQFYDGQLLGWHMGGNLGGITGYSTGLGPDFAFGVVGNSIFIPERSPYVLGTAPKFSVTEISAVPLPAAVWAFGAGLLGLLGLKRRRKMKMLRAATA